MTELTPFLRPCSRLCPIHLRKLRDVQIVRNMRRIAPTATWVQRAGGKGAVDVAAAWAVRALAVARGADAAEFLLPKW